MHDNLDIGFLKERIISIRSALFISQDTGELKLPNGLINVLKVDDEGQVWFFIHRPRQYLFAFNQTFQARLDFYRKGEDCFLRASGNAFMIDEHPEGYPSLDQRVDVDWPFNGQQMMLMIMKILEVDYYETSEADPAGILPNLRSWFNRRFLPKPGFGPYVLDPAQPVFRLLEPN